MRKIGLINVISILILSLILSKAQSNDHSDTQKNADAPTITVTKLDMNNTKLELSYEVSNETGQDAWILKGIGRSGTFSMTFMDEDYKTLLLRRSFGIPRHIHGNALYGRYVRLPASQSQTESVSLHFPLLLSPGLAFEELKQQDVAIRLSIEIGYYNGNLHQMIRTILEKAEKADADANLSLIERWFGGLLGYNKLMEGLRSRDEEVIIPYMDQNLLGEQVLRFTVEDLHIPYTEVEVYSKNRKTPDLTNCTRVEIRYEPSMLDYFFPYSFQQNLLSHTEREYLRSQKTISIDDLQDLKILTNEICVGNEDYFIMIGAIMERNVAHIDCYNRNERLTSFTIHDNTYLVTEQKNQIRYYKQIGSLRKITPQIRPYELRIKCATNLKDLWYRFNLYQKASKNVRIGLFKRREKRPYPAPKTWCDSIVRAYKSVGYNKGTVLKSFVCLSSGKGKCHYAMNPNCKYDSPGDMVLLFETKAGWNQSGGPELFTFDNHDPRGGCVLLNDGTVKFIRTEEELNNLRWK